jgi:NitT/TauT family transport system ATP-binding protein
MKLRDLSIYYNKDPVVKGISFEVKTGEIVSLIGVSGCGKTSILKAVAGICGQFSRVSGDLSFDDEPQRSRNIGFMFQDPALFPHLRVLENTTLPLELKGIDKETRKMAAREMLERIGLKELERRLPRELSGGQQQRVSLARALVSGPDTLLLDEPFSKLDALTRKKLNLMFLKLWQEMKQTVLFVTHDIDEAIMMSHQVVVLSEQPARVNKIFNIDLPFPRNYGLRHQEKFIDLSIKIERSLGVFESH